MKSVSKTTLLLVFTITIHLTTTTVNSIGVNYGTLANNLPPPKQVAQFLKNKTVIDRIKIFDANPEILSAFADTGILVAVTVPNDEIPNMVDVGYARKWLVTNIKPFHPKTKINYILVGSEILHWGPENLRTNLVAAMKSLHTALADEALHGIKISTAHSLAILDASEPPSLARFRPFWEQTILAPLLQFHRDTKSPFMVNPYPYFGYTPSNASFALFQPNKGIFDPHTKKTYGNMFDMLMDAVYISMKKLGYEDVELSAGETGWASLGDTWEIQCSVPNAAAYNGGLVKKYNAGRGTPLIPKKRIETYIFALFNENQKEGSLAERNFGLFRPDFTPVYDIGIMRAAGAAAAPVQNNPTPARPAPIKGGGGSTRSSPAQGRGKKWCIAKPGASNAVLQDNLSYVCSQPNVNCVPIQPGGICFNPSNVRAHASYAMNAFYQANGRNNFNCDFAGTGEIVSNDPSYAACKYSS